MKNTTDVAPKVGYREKNWNTPPFNITLPNNVSGNLLSAIIEVCEMQYGHKSTVVSHSDNSPGDLTIKVSPVGTVADQVSAVGAILEENESLCLDSKADRETLIESLLLEGYRVDRKQATL